MTTRRLVPRGSAPYREFVRLYELARSLRSTEVDRWNGDLYVTDSGWGGFDPRSGSISLSGPLVIDRLTGSVTPEQRAEALATVLHEATHAGMATDAPAEPNAVRSQLSLGLMEGFAEVRTLADFEVFAQLAGYPELALPHPAYPGAFAATRSLIEQASGPAKCADTIISEAVRGPGVMHFDQLADAVLRNRLTDVVPYREEDRRAVRAALIGTMAHPAWQILKDSSWATGQKVGSEIRQALNATVDEIRRHYRATPRQVFPGGVPNPHAERVVDRATSPRPAPETSAVNASPGWTHPNTRFLSGTAGAAGATRGCPILRDGSRARGASSGGSPERERGGG